MKQVLSKFDSFLISRPIGVSNVLLRVGLAVVLLYAAVASTLDPDEWKGFLPVLLTDIADANMLLAAFSIYELLLAVWLLSGVCVRYAAMLCAVTLAGIVVSNVSLFAISFRDIGLMFAAVALALLPQTTKLDATTR